jgi:type IV secretory pathway protease TraF
VAGLLVARGYLAPQTPLLKPVAALAGDEVCVAATGVQINRTWQAPVATVDTAGRPLPSWWGCVTLGADEVFLLSTQHAQSLDSRYFGPVPVTRLLGRATPVWTW